MDYERYVSPYAAAQLLDKGKVKNRFAIRSMTSDKHYTIGFDCSAGHWVCSCPSFRFRSGRGSGKTCKHLEREELSGRDPERQKEWVSKFNAIQTQSRHRWSKTDIRAATASFIE